MNVLMSLLSKEESRNKNMIAEYIRELETLPTGSLKLKRIKNGTYVYLTYRIGKKVITKYIGKDEKKIKAIQDQLQRRKQIEEILRMLKQEEKQIKRMEKML